MLCRELAAGAGRHADNQRHGELAARHMRDRRGVVDDLVERQQAEIDRHDLDDRPHAGHRRADARRRRRRLSESGVSRMRSSPSSSMSPLVTA